jgi:exosortase/archaeosortase family protein
MKKKSFSKFVIKFILLFLFFYYFFISIIAVTAPGGYYSSFIDHYFNLIAWLKDSLILGTGSLLKLLGYDTYTLDNFIIRLSGGKGVRIAHDCAGHGIISFWAAYVISIYLPLKPKLFWLIAGLFVLWFINVLRISLLILALNLNWPMPLGVDHHTWFNIISYLFIFVMILLLERKMNKTEASIINPNPAKQ